MSNLLIFIKEEDFGEDILLVANNEHDMSEYLISKYCAYNIKFSDIGTSYGTLTFKDRHGFSHTGKCFYAKKI